MPSTWENLSDPIFDHARLRPDALALIEGDRSVTYRELANGIAKASVHFHELGVKPGELVALAMSSNIEHVVLSFGLMRMGGVPLDLPPRPPARSIVNPVKLFNVSRLVRETNAITAPAGIQVHELDSDWQTKLAAQTGDHRNVRDGDEVHNFSMTSGSTGISKGVLTTRRQWLARFDTALKLFPDVFSSERPANLLIIGGMGFSAFFFFLANQLFVGGPVVLMTDNHKPDYLRDQINRWEDAVSLITPPLARQFLADAGEASPIFPKVRALFIGAAPLYPEEKAAVIKKLTPNLREVYGSAACGFISTLSAGEIAAHGDSVGRPAPGLEVEVVDAERKPVPAGQPGHLRCRGAGISQGFYGETPGTPEKPEGFRDGWYYPGDTGAIDADGYIHVKGRLSDVIYRRGTEISPLELEQIIARHPSIAEAAVVGVPGKDKDEQVMAFVVPRAQPEKAALAEYCRASIPNEKFPDRVFFVKALPKNANGKLDRLQLKALAKRGPPKPVVSLQSKREERAKQSPLRIGKGRPDASGMQTIAAIEAHLQALNDELLVKPQPNCTLSRGQRELIATAAAAAEECFSAMDLHGAIAVELLGNEKPNLSGLIEEVKQGRFQKLDPKLRSLAEIARIVAASPRQLTQAHLDAASKAGASDTDVVLTIAIASADAMYSHRVESMHAPTPTNDAAHADTARMIAQQGYKSARETVVSGPKMVRAKGTS
jgi:long-chain acyl-CoA synthetase